MIFTGLFRSKSKHRPSIPPGRRVYAVGDVHGRLDLYDTLLDLIAQDQIGRSEITPEVVLLGDLIDRGQDSAGVVRRAMAPPHWAQVSALMGNHEAAMIAALSGNAKAMRMWQSFGGRESLLSWGLTETVLNENSLEDIANAALAEIPRREIEWIMKLPQHRHIGDYFLVHAGVRPGVALVDQAPADSYWIREEFLESKRAHGAMVVHGHSIVSEVEEHSNRIGIDTGAYITGRLTALALEGEDRWLIQT